MGWTSESNIRISDHSQLERMLHHASQAMLHETSKQAHSVIYLMLFWYTVCSNVFIKQETIYSSTTRNKAYYYRKRTCWGKKFKRFVFFESKPSFLHVHFKHHVCLVLGFLLSDVWVIQYTQKASWRITIQKEVIPRYWWPRITWIDTWKMLSWTMVRLHNGKTATMNPLDQHM